jgi:DNA mismatch endonuclease, patch repair protein
MSDIYSKKKRSRIMSRIRASGNRATELRLISIFKAASITGWRRKQGLPGRPDFVFRKQRVVVFVDGCFWHGCAMHGRRPTTNTVFWDKKLEGNIARDRLVDRELRQQGWRIVRIWQHELTKRDEARLVTRLLRVFETTNCANLDLDP